MSLRGKDVVAVAVSDGVLWCMDNDGEGGPLSRSHEFILAPINGPICPLDFVFLFDVVLFGPSRPAGPLELPASAIVEDCSMVSFKGEPPKLNGLERLLS